jgi:hypothetical protein
MIYNMKMESYLNQINNNSKLCEASNSAGISILQGINCSGESYFYLEHNSCNLNNKSKVKSTGEMLTQLEWDCNEIYINDSEDIIYLLEAALTTLKSIKAILTTKYPLKSFDICMSLDDGKGCDVFPAVTIRFYNNLDNYFISHDKSELEKFDQPILIESIN